MAFRRWRSRRPTRKPRMNAKKAQKVVTKVRKAKAKRNMDTFFLRVKTEAMIIPVQGLATANYFFATHTLSPVNSSSLSYNNNAEFNLYRLQYDKFRVNSVHVKVIPKANFLSQVEAQNEDALNVSGDGLWHTVIDRDSNGISNVAALSRYPSYRKFDQKKPWSRSYAVRYPTGVWIDCQAPATFEMDKSIGLQGGITMYAENFLEENSELFNEPVAQIEVSYNIVFQGKTSHSLSAVRDEEGNLVGMTITADNGKNNVAETPFSNIRGSLADTRAESDLGAETGITETSITDLGNA